MLLEKLTVKFSYVHGRIDVGNSFVIGGKLVDMYSITDQFTHYLQENNVRKYQCLMRQKIVESTK